MGVGQGALYLEVFFYCLETIVLADFNLKASTLQPVFGDNVTLHCSSGLSKAIDVTVNFIFQTHSKAKLITKQFVCNESEYHLGNKWWIRRTGTIPHDCILEIIGVDGSDSGMYQCIGDLRSSATGESEGAPSNTVNISVIAHEDTISPAFVTIVTSVNESTEVISISIGATMLLILIALFVIGWRIRKKYYDNEQGQPYVPIDERSIAEREGKTRNVLEYYNTFSFLMLFTLLTILHGQLDSLSS